MPALSMEHKLAFFKQNGYYVQHGALHADEVAQVIAGIEDAGGNSSDVFHLTEKLEAFAAEHGIRLLCDEVYRLLEHDAADRLPTLVSRRLRRWGRVALLTARRFMQYLLLPPWE